jgi:hypothetical protein
MDWGDPGFIMAIIAMSTIGWLLNNWIRARHGYALEDEWGGKTAKGDKDVAALKAENTELKERLSLFEDRVIVLERIVTDSGYQLTHEIEGLRLTGRNS